MAANPYESARLLSEYLLFHYGKAHDILPYPFGPVGALDFAARVVAETLDTRGLLTARRALDLGCAVGRSSFELARWCTEVIGIDFSESFIQAAEGMAVNGRAVCWRAEEGEIAASGWVEAPPDVDRRRVRFEVGDACALRPDLGRFDIVLLANLLDRLPDPRRCLDRLPDLVAPGGQLVIASPFTWLEEYTPREHWLGGYEEDGDPVRSADALLKALDADFVFEQQTEVPFLIREHARKYQWSVSWAGRWRRRS